MMWLFLRYMSTGARGSGARVMYSWYIYNIYIQL